MYGWHKRNNEITSYVGRRTEVVVPSEIDGETITSIGSEAFSPYKKHLSDSSKNIRESITKVYLPETIKEIGEFSFRGCKSLKEINFPDSLEKIDHRAFDGCTSLEKITIQSTVKFGLEAFFNCVNLKEVIFKNDFCDKEFSSLKGQYTFECCDSLEHVVLPNNLVYIGGGFFSHCISLKKIEFPPTLVQICPDAFYGCSSLEKVRLPDSVREVHISTFARCGKFSFVGKKGSVAEVFSKKNGIPFIAED